LEIITNLELKENRRYFPHCATVITIFKVPSKHTPDTVINFDLIIYATSPATISFQYMILERQKHMREGDKESYLRTDVKDKRYILKSKFILHDKNCIYT